MFKVRDIVRMELGRIYIASLEIPEGFRGGEELVMIPGRR